MKIRFYSLLAGFVLTVFQPLSAQTITLAPPGDNQVSETTQFIGSLVKVTIHYSSPDVTGPDGKSRKGQIWGKLVPYGFNDLGFGTSKAAPWRAGANENTTITFSHDVEVQGKPLSAGTYGFFVVAQESGPWTLIFSKNSTSWGSYFYDEKEDALRVTTEPKTAPFHEWLTFEFTDRQPTQTTVELMWEEKSIPFVVSVPNMPAVYLANIRNELRTEPGFNWQGWVAASQFCVANKINLDEALVWAEKAISEPSIGQKNFQTLSNKAAVLTATGKKDEARAIMNQAISEPTATVNDLHQYGRQLLREGAKKEALDVFVMNAKRFNNAWPTNMGLSRGYSANGDFKNALKFAKLALEQAPDKLNKDFIAAAIAKLENKQDIN